MAWQSTYRPAQFAATCCAVLFFSSGVSESRLAVYAAENAALYSLAAPPWKTGDARSLPEPVVRVSAAQAGDYGGAGAYQSAPGASSDQSQSIADPYAASPYNAGAQSRYLLTTQAYERLSQNYDQPAVGPKTYADYSPKGYYPSDYQEAPGTPLYEPLYPPAPIASEAYNNFVVRGPVPGSYLVPGSSTAFRFSGFVRLGANFDFNSVGTPDTFVPRTIPIPQSPGQNVNYSARPTRISLDTWTPTSVNDWVVHTFIQFDFLSGNPPGVGSSSNPRLRFAFVDFGYFRVGQDTTVFMDPRVFPRTADFQGPNGIVNSRQGLGRVTVPLAEKLFLAAAAEQPFSDITTSGLGANVQDVPDFTSHLRYEDDLGHAQVATIVRSVNYRETGSSVTRDTGWGVNVSGSLHPWALLMETNPVRDTNPSGLTRSRVLLQYVTGSGIERYIQDTSGIGLDGAIAAGGVFRTIGVSAWTASYEHWLSEKWLTNLTYSNVNLHSVNGLPGNTFAGSDYVATSLWYIPVRNMSVGIEYLWGRRENQDGASARAQRIQTVFQYNF